MGLPLLRPARRRLVAMGLAALLLSSVAGPARAYVPSLEELYNLVGDQRPAIQRAILETRTYVFDPLHLLTPVEGDRHPDAVPPAAEARSFRQKIYWIRNAFLGIETYAEDGTLLHFYLDEGFRPVQGNLTAGRVFAEADIVHPYLPFIAADPARWRQAVTYWGLNPNSVDIARGAKGAVRYRLLEAEGRALWLEPELLRPTRVQTRLAGADGNEQALTIEFREFLFIGDSNNDAENLFFPRTVNFLLDGKLMKQSVLLRFQADPSVQGFPITKLRALAVKAQPPRPISMLPLSEDQR